MRSDWLCEKTANIILGAMQPVNALVLAVSAATGLRVSDVLSIKTESLQQRMTVREMKTGKNKRIYVPSQLLLKMQQQAGRIWVFEHRTNYRSHRTRQAVYKDIKACADFYKRNGTIAKGAQISPHSLRKLSAVNEFERSGNMAAVGKFLNHNAKDKGVTEIYANAEEITKIKLRRRK